MRSIEGEQTLVRIFIGNSDKWGRQPLDRALVERLRREGFAGVTVLRGVGGFGAQSVVHSSRVLDLSSDVPLILEIVEDEEHVERLLAVLDEMMDGGLVTLEKVRVIRYAAREKKRT